MTSIIDWMVPSKDGGAPIIQEEYENIVHKFFLINKLNVHSNTRMYIK